LEITMTATTEASPPREPSLYDLSLKLARIEGVLDVLGRKADDPTEPEDPK
jgi:hypothetical protein